MGKWVRNFLILVAGVTLAGWIGVLFVPHQDVAKQQEEIDKQKADLEAKMAAEEAKKQ